MDNVSDKARAVAHYVPMAAAAKRGPQHQMAIDSNDNIVGVSYLGVNWDVAVDIEPADAEHPYPLAKIYAVKLNEVWFSIFWVGEHGPLIDALQRQYDRMPNNGDDEAGDGDRITAAMLEDRQ